MSYQDRLITALREGFVIDRVGLDDFRLRQIGASGEDSVRLIAEEAKVSARVKSMTGDALEALGEVGEDASGETAAVGLLAVHVEELIAADPDVTRVVVTPVGLHSDRADSVH